LWDLFPPESILQPMKKFDHQSAGQPPDTLVLAIRKVLHPLVRLMLSFQISYPFLINILKSVYVEVAEREFAVAKRSSDSRINLLTGVHRKDVKRLRAEPNHGSAMPRNVSIGAQLIAYWLGSEEFQDSEGKPKPLKLRAAADNSNTLSFDDLVAKVCKQDIRPRVILDEWLHLGVTSLDSEGRVILNTGAFTPEKGLDEKIFFFSRNIHDHISASTHNLLGKKPSYFDRSVYYDKLSARSADQLGKLADLMGTQALTAVNRKALQLQKKDEQSGPRDSNGSYRINFGVFNYSTTYNSVEDSRTVDKTNGETGEDL